MRRGSDALDAAGAAALVRAMADGIAARGKAEPGDKTMYDAWHPAAEAAERAAANDVGSVANVLRAAAGAADEGARATIDLQARKGRSAKLGERSVGHMDAGAASTSLLPARARRHRRVGQCGGGRDDGRDGRMITKRIATADVLERLRDKVRRRVPIMIASAGGGLVARLLEEQGVDCINTFSGARLRANGMGTMSMMWPILDSNRQTLDYTREDIMPALSGRAFVCGLPERERSAQGHARRARRLPPNGRRRGVEHRPVRQLRGRGQRDSPRADERRHHARQRDRHAAPRPARRWTWSRSGSRSRTRTRCGVVEEARPHVFCYHAGTTRGGLTGYDDGRTIADTAAATEKVYRAAREIDPDVILVGHGAAMETPEDAQYMLDHTSGHGFWTGSSTERLPIERAVTAAAAEFAALHFADAGNGP